EAVGLCLTAGPCFRVSETCLALLRPDFGVGSRNGGTDVLELSQHLGQFRLIVLISIGSTTGKTLVLLDNRARRPLLQLALTLRPDALVCDSVQARQPGLHTLAETPIALVLLELTGV